MFDLDPSAYAHDDRFSTVAVMVLLAILALCVSQALLGEDE